ncbi:unnamed protein product [Amoebophrya sp. A25]|nr:unnamed protein product [Amoebophrya sp. A25]|eukprot:GSA25T00010045001.1
MPYSYQHYLEAALQLTGTSRFRRRTSVSTTSFADNDAATPAQPVGPDDDPQNDPSISPYSGADAPISGPPERDEGSANFFQPAPTGDEATAEERRNRVRNMRAIKQKVDGAGQLMTKDGMKRAAYDMTRKGMEQAKKVTADKIANGFATAQRVVVDTATTSYKYAKDEAETQIDQTKKLFSGKIKFEAPKVEDLASKEGAAKAIGQYAASALAAKALSRVDGNSYDANWAASWDSTFGGTTVSTASPNSLFMHHNRDDGEWTENNPDATMPGTKGTDISTPIRISITAESPYQPQDLPLVAIKMFQPKSGKPTGVLKITSPDVHTFLVPEMTFL